MTFGEQTSIDLHNIIADWPVQFTWEGVEYTGTPSGKSLRRVPELGGFQDQPEIVLVVPLKTRDRASTFAQVPVPGNTVVIGHHTYRIERTELDEFSEALQMDLRSANL